MIIFVITILYKKSKDNGTSNILTEEVPTLNVEETSNMELAFDSAVSEVRELYKNYGSQNFSVYFSDDFINNYMENGSTNIINNIKLVDFDGVDIYDTEGNKIKEFPTTYADGTEITYETESYEVAPNKNYLLKIYSHDSSYCYYYILKYDKNGNASLKEICYTLRETGNIDTIYESLVTDETV
jgi:hypothetical protein